MKIGRKLTLYWDACIFLHWLSDPVKDKSVVDGIEDVVKMSERGDATIFTSVITRIEVLRGKMADDVADKFTALFPRAVEWVNVDPRIAQMAHDIRDFYHAPDKRDMGLPDCIHLATAIIWEADEMHTLDGSSHKLRRHDLIPLSGNVLGGRYKLKIIKPVRVLPLLFQKPDEPKIEPIDETTAKAGEETTGSNEMSREETDTPPVPGVVEDTTLGGDASEAGGSGDATTDIKAESKTEVTEKEVRSPVEPTAPPAPTPTPKKKQE
jgi:predicted nucleic acid-binding protein